MDSLEVGDAQGAGEVDVVDGHAEAGVDGFSILLPGNRDGKIARTHDAGHEDAMADGISRELKRLNEGRHCRKPEHNVKNTDKPNGSASFYGEPYMRRLLVLDDTTFHSDVDALVPEQLGLNEHMAAVLSFIQFFLHVEQLQRAVVLERPLPVIKREQVGILEPFDGVIWVTDHVAVDVHVPPGNSGEVFHWSYVSRTFGDKNASIKITFEL